MFDSFFIFLPVIFQGAEGIPGSKGLPGMKGPPGNEVSILYVG